MLSLTVTALAAIDEAAGHRQPDGNSITLGSDVTANTSLSLTAMSGSISQSSGALMSSGACNVDAGASTITFAHNVIVWNARVHRGNNEPEPDRCV